jgi:hypothetical protein
MMCVPTLDNRMHDQNSKSWHTSVKCRITESPSRSVMVQRTCAVSKKSGQTIRHYCPVQGVIGVEED